VLLQHPRAREGGG